MPVCGLDPDSAFKLPAKVGLIRHFAGAGAGSAGLAVPGPLPTASVPATTTGGGGAVRSTSWCMAMTQAIAAVHAARMSDG
jgi:hypothetical protein